MKLVVALAGRIGSGKTVVVEHLEAGYGADTRRFSQILMDVLERLSLPSSRINLQKLGEILRKEFGESVLVDAFERDLETTRAEIVVVDGVRYLNELELVRRFPCIFIYVDASPEVRFERVRKRGEKDESDITFEEFLESEQRETERYVGELEPEADYIIDNSGTLEDLKNNVDKIMKRELGKEK